MNQNEKKYSQRIARIIRAARKLRNITQIELAQKLGITQGTLSKIESGTLVVSTPIWFEFCNIVKISSRSFLFDYIDFPIDEANSQRSSELALSGHFRLSKRYNYSRGSTVREVRPILSYARKAWGLKKFIAYLQKVEIDPDFFVVLPNRINLQFYYDLMSELENSGALNAPELQKHISASFIKPEDHGIIGDELIKSQNPKEILKTLIRRQRLYQSNFHFSTNFHSNEMIIQAEPMPFIASFNAEKAITESICNHRTHFFEASLKIGATKSVKVKHTLCFFQGAPKCQFHVHL